MEITEETACIRNCKSKTHVQEEKDAQIRANRKAEIDFTPIRLYQAYMPLDPIQKQERKRNPNTLNAEKSTPKGQLLGTPQPSRQFYYREKFLWLGVPQQTA